MDNKELQISIQNEFLLMFIIFKKAFLNENLDFERKVYWPELPY